MNDCWTLVGGCAAVMFAASAIFCLMVALMLVLPVLLARLIARSGVMSLLLLGGRGKPLVCAGR